MGRPARGLPARGRPRLERLHPDRGPTPRRRPGGRAVHGAGALRAAPLHVPRRVLDAPRHPGHPAVRATVSPRSADHDPPVLSGAGTRHERALERRRHIAVRQRAAADRRDAGADDGRAVPAVRTGSVGAGRRARDRAVCGQSELRVLRRAMGVRIVRPAPRARGGGAGVARAVEPVEPAAAPSSRRRGAPDVPDHAADRARRRGLAPDDLVCAGPVPARVGRP